MNQGLPAPGDQHKYTLNKWVLNFPSDLSTMMRCVRELYDIVPHLASMGKDVKDKCLVIRDKFIITLCQDYVQYCVRERVEDYGVMTPAMLVYTVCACLSLVGEGKTTLKCDKRARKMGFTLENDIQNAKDVFLSIWLLNTRLQLSGMKKKEDVEVVKAHIRYIFLHSFYYTQVQLAESELGQGMPLELFRKERGNSAVFSLNEAAIRRCVEGLCRPMKSVLLFLSLTLVPAMEVDPESKSKLTEHIDRTASDLENNEPFRAELRNYLEHASVTGYDFALFTEIEKMANYTAYTLLLLSRTSLFNSKRETFIKCVLLDQVCKIDDFDTSGMNTMTTKLTAILLKLYPLHACFSKDHQISFIGDHFLYECHIPEMIDRCKNDSAPTIILIFGGVHVLFNNVLYVCNKGAVQAAHTWLQLVMIDCQGKINRVDVTKTINQIYLGHEKNLRLALQNNWSTDVRIFS